MHRHLGCPWILGLLAVWVASTAWAEQAVVKVRRANLRAAPRKDAPIITQVPQGQALEVLERRDGWLKVRYGDIEGFVADSLVEFVEPQKPTPSPSPPSRVEPSPPPQAEPVPSPRRPPGPPPPPRASQTAGTASVGATLSIADDVDVGLGVRAFWNLRRLARNLELLTTFDYFFPGGGLSYFEINGNLVYNFHLRQTSLTPYAGLGLNIAHASVEGFFGFEASDTDIGVNFLGGVKYPLSRLLIFGELRVEAGGGEQFVVAGGVLYLW
ncbi:hypothetical protein HRbin11_00778 [bacterium HR11]|nr:hypothetical protein HRbin11_00778 [bacterium HR11]